MTAPPENLLPLPLDDLFDQIKKRAYESPDKQKLITTELEKLLKKVNKLDTGIYVDEVANKEILAQMQEKLKPYVSKDMKIVELRKLGQLVAQKSGVPITESEKKKVNLLYWFHMHWGTLKVWLDNIQYDQSRDMQREANPYQ
ncbi:hypothetical protein TVAG_239550 [Trichomonas vaginalis G3]|uniref:Uncharacterized protein n=1 Tax=Trichomonas vaginalis (strain ATCC PRA-98 / G3) TaxID=412133 RepID=A2DGI3_TRIV3|nr:hypothetical protein TVAGG3_0965790 [Trichomonas vaginalis G3]EAY20579.1 hypothetical protein TVAG_239550 [Trichomonas vaginalis G3]KAI5488227.1 hypothetical protein TVAGG3_0965790 [Trichomonas vaginalis G3]|eukprot:XP_001581565.1 hypothetical protein [Trichomonas vaginalis G3]